MYKLVHTVEDDNHVVSSRDVIHTFPTKPDLGMISARMYSVGLHCKDTQTLQAIWEGDCVLIDCRNNCIQLVEG